MTKISWVIVALVTKFFAANDMILRLKAHLFFVMNTIVTIGCEKSILNIFAVFHRENFVANSIILYVIFALAKRVPICYEVRRLKFFENFYYML